jgi:hypothetical protein
VLQSLTDPLLPDYTKFDMASTFRNACLSGNFSERISRLFDVRSQFIRIQRRTYLYSHKSVPSLLAEAPKNTLLTEYEDHQFLAA